MEKSKEQLDCLTICKMVFSLKHLYKGFFKIKEIDYKKKNIIFDWIEALSAVMETEEYEKFFNSTITMKQIDNYLLIEYNCNKIIESENLIRKKTNRIILDLRGECVV